MVISLISALRQDVLHVHALISRALMPTQGLAISTSQISRARKKVSDRKALELHCRAEHNSRALLIVHATAIIIKKEVISVRKAAINSVRKAVMAHRTDMVAHKVRADMVSKVATAVPSRAVTVVLSKVDTVVLSRADTVVLSRLATVVLSKADTVVLSRVVMVVLSRAVTVVLSRADIADTLRDMIQTQNTALRNVLNIRRRTTIQTSRFVLTSILQMQVFAVDEKPTNIYRQVS